MPTSVSLIVKSALSAGSPQLRVSQSLRPPTQLLPGVVFAVVSREDDPLLDGDGGLWAARVQVDGWGANWEDAESVAEEARALMLTATTFSATVIGGFHDFEDDTRLCRVSRDFSIRYEA